MSGDDNFELPLFPLETVLFPGGRLTLRIFEPRYLDMISRCLREDSAFGVCLIRDGGESGAATTAPVGTLARIVDWHPGGDGILGVVAVGGERFTIDESWQLKDGLNAARVTSIAADEPTPLPAEWRPHALILRRILNALETPNDEADFDEAGWVGCRFAEALPLPLAQKQVLLEMTNPLERLRMLRPLVESARRKR
ncbi:MAG TPA: LON peptidase substrate-binding domain-containing protein [Gammaproteobacteria bacterium]|nr:LON peptidase substrate-binding domain-containing protein [Gammaproteobacteria bacterium]